jgi:transposase
MNTAVTRRTEGSIRETVLYMALELSDRKWMLAFTTGMGQKPRIRQVPARDLAVLAREVEKAKRRFGLAAATRVLSCYEAGMDGFWVHRALEEAGLENVVVDSSSIETKRRGRHAKTDRLDAGALVTKLVDYWAGNRRTWSVVHVPPEAAEDERHNSRELRRLRDEQTALGNTIKGLLKTQGIRLQRVRRDFADRVSELRRWNGSALGSELQAQLVRLFARMQLVRQHMREIEARRSQLLEGTTNAAQMARQLADLRGVGETSGWMLATELYGWRNFRNRRQVGGLLGLVSLPWRSGNDAHDQSISRAGPTRVRAGLIELAWLWVRYQPTSTLTRWFQEKYAHGGKRMRRIGIVALARKLAVEFWKYLETGALPEGALTKT